MIRGAERACVDLSRRRAQSGSGFRASGFGFDSDLVGNGALSEEKDRLGHVRARTPHVHRPAPVAAAREGQSESREERGKGEGGGRGRREKGEGRVRGEKGEGREEKGKRERKGRGRRESEMGEGRSEIGEREGMRGRGEKGGGKREREGEGERGREEEGERGIPDEVEAMSGRVLEHDLRVQKASPQYYSIPSSVLNHRSDTSMRPMRVCHTMMRDASATSSYDDHNERYDFGIITRDTAR
eukprot:840084-Rhodomonas_salina.1